MYRTYGIRAMQELLKRSYCRGAVVEEHKPAMRHTVSGNGSHFMPLSVNGAAVIIFNKAGYALLMAPVQTDVSGAQVND